MLCLQILSPVSTAHLMKEPGTDNFITFTSEFNFIHNYFNVIRIRSATERETIINIPTKMAYYIHSFAVTRNYAIFFAGPVYLDMYLVSVKHKWSVHNVDMF